MTILKTTILSLLLLASCAPCPDKLTVSGPIPADLDKVLATAQCDVRGSLEFVDAQWFTCGSFNKVVGCTWGDAHGCGVGDVKMYVAYQPDVLDPANAASTSLPHELLHACGLIPID